MNFRGQRFNPLTELPHNYGHLIVLIEERKKLARLLQGQLLLLVHFKGNLFAMFRFRL